MAFTLADAIIRLENFGLLDVLLPFLLVFTILFAVLEKTGVLGTGARGKRFNATVALAIALLIVIPHVVYPSGDNRDGRLGGALSGLPDVVEIMNNSLPSVAIWIIMIISLLILIGLVAPDWITNLAGNSQTKWVGSILGGLAIIAVIYIFGSSAGFFQNINYGPFAFLADPGNQVTILIVAAFAGIVYLVMGGDDGGGNGRKKKNKDGDDATE